MSQDIKRGGGRHVHCAFKGGNLQQKHSSLWKSTWESVQKVDKRSIVWHMHKSAMMLSVCKVAQMVLVIKKNHVMK